MNPALLEMRNPQQRGWRLQRKYCSCLIKKLNYLDGEKFSMLVRCVNKSVKACLVVSRLSSNRVTNQHSMEKLAGSESSYADSLAEHQPFRWKRGKVEAHTDLGFWQQNGSDWVKPQSVHDQIMCVWVCGRGQQHPGHQWPPPAPVVRLLRVKLDGECHPRTERVGDRPAICGSTGCTSLTNSHTVLSSASVGEFVYVCVITKTPE